MAVATLGLELAKRTVHSRLRDVSTNIDNHEFVSLPETHCKAVLPVAWVNAMVNWFKHFESSSVGTKPRHHSRL